MPIAQMVMLSHQPAPPGMVAEPIAVTRIDPTWREIEDAITAMDATRFLVLVSSRLDLDAVSDPDALVVEFGEGHGYMLYQQALHTEIGKSAWRSRSAVNVLEPSTLDISMVLQIVAAYGKGSSFEDIERQFPEV